MAPKLRFRVNDLRDIARRYQYDSESHIRDLRKPILQRGYLTKADLLTITYWKSPRSSSRVEKNSESYIREVTGCALATRSERLRIEMLTLLDGVGWPSASVILHFFHKQRYPILDYRALWSVSLKVPNQYNFDLWCEYVVYCRELASKANVTMRTLDKALWQYSKENQRAE